MVNETNKPAGEEKHGKPTKVEDRQAVENQSSVKPEEYPDPAGGKPDYKR